MTENFGNLEVVGVDSQGNARTTLRIRRLIVSNSMKACSSFVYSRVTLSKMPPTGDRSADGYVIMVFIIMERSMQQIWLTFNTFHSSPGPTEIRSFVRQKSFVRMSPACLSILGPEPDI